jgi:hypothetical protein
MTAESIGLQDLQDHQDWSVIYSGYLQDKANKFLNCMF